MTKILLAMFLRFSFFSVFFEIFSLFFAISLNILRTFAYFILHMVCVCLKNHIDWWASHFVFRFFFSIRLQSFDCQIDFLTAQLFKQFTPLQHKSLLIFLAINKTKESTEYRGKLPHSWWIFRSKWLCCSDLLRRNLITLIHSV